MSFFVVFGGIGYYDLVAFSFTKISLPFLMIDLPSYGVVEF